MADKVYKFSSDFKAMSEGDFIQEIRKRFKVTKKEAKEIYNDLHGNSTASPKKDKPVNKKINTGKNSVSGVEEVKGDTVGHSEDTTE